MGVKVPTPERPIPLTQSVSLTPFSESVASQHFLHQKFDRKFSLFEFSFRQRRKRRCVPLFGWNINFFISLHLYLLLFYLYPSVPLLQYNHNSESKLSFFRVVWCDEGEEEELVIVVQCICIGCLAVTDILIEGGN